MNPLKIEPDFDGKLGFWEPEIDVARVRGRGYVGMAALRVLNLRNLVDVGVLLGRVCYEKHGVVTGEGGLAKLVEKLYDSINQQQLDSQVSNQVYEAKGKFERYGYNKSLDLVDEQELKRNASVWIELISKSVAARVAFEPSKPIILNAESLMQSATNYSNPFFDDKVWASLTDVAKNDFKETTRCFMAGAWTAAAMTALRGAEGVLRQHYEFKAGAKSGEKKWADIVKELESRSAVDKTLLGYLNFIRERRNETQHPDKTYDQRESENIFTVVINAVTAMRKESLATSTLQV